jgi:hypothetical protein
MSMAPVPACGSCAEIARAILASLAGAEARSRPFPNWRLSEVLPEAMAQRLACTEIPPARRAGSSGRRELSNDGRVYFAGPRLRAIPGARAVALAFQSLEVAQALMLLTGAVLLGTYLRIEYAVDLDGFWLEPHTDVGAKAFSLLLQLAAPGQEDLGTDLYAAPGVWTERIPFAWNSALVFVPSDRSWHGFEPRPIAGPRRSIIVNYVTEAWRAREQLAFPGQPVGGVLQLQPA